MDFSSKYGYFFGAVAEPWIALTQFLDPGWDYLYSGFDDPPCKYDSSTKKLTAWGRFGKDHNTFCIANKSKTIVYVRDYLSKGLNPGQKVTIKGPFGSEASMWRKYVNGNEVKRVVVKYKTNDDNSYNVLPPKFKLERADGISVKLFGEDGEEIKFSGSDKAKFTVDDSSILFPFSFEKNGIIMGGNSKGSTFLNIKLPSPYELEKSRYEIEVTDANFENRLQLYIAKNEDPINGVYKPIGYHYDDVKKGDVLYLKIKYGGEWKPIGMKKSYAKFEQYYDVEKKMDTFDAIEIDPLVPQNPGRSYIYKIAVKNKHSSAVTVEISFKQKSDPTKIGDFLILAFK